MSHPAQLVSLVPPAPLTDEVFPFNRPAFLEIQRYQQEDLAFLQSPPVQALVGVGDIVGGGSAAVVGGVSHAVSGVASSLFGGLGQITASIPGSGLIGQVGAITVGTIDTAGSAAEQLVDPTRIAREHYHYSTDVKNALPPAIDAVDKLIHDFSFNAGHAVQDLYENLASKGIQIINGLEATLAEVDTALSNLNKVLTKNNLQENLIVGHDKYKSVTQIRSKNYLQELSDNLPPILKTVEEVKAAFASITASFEVAKVRINIGVIDPKQIFAEKHEDVVTAWQAFEVKRKTMTYLPYKY